MISDFVEGADLCDIIKDPATDPEKSYVELDPKIDNATLNTIFDQISDFMFQFFQFDFSRIGSISKDDADV